MPDSRIALVPVEGAETRIYTELAWDGYGMTDDQAMEATLGIMSALGLDREGWPTREELRPRVKQLKWSEPHPSHTYPEWRARDIEIDFEAVIDKGQPLMYGKFPLRIDGYWSKEKFDTLNAAKAHAQAEFERRVLSALEPASRIRKALGR